MKRVLWQSSGFVLGTVFGGMAIVTMLSLAIMVRAVTKYDEMEKSKTA